MRTVKNHCNTYMKSLLDRVGCSHYIGIIGIHGSNNVKYEVFPDYKRGRPVDKPPHWNRVMNYLISEWGFSCISGCEVDDAVRLCYERTPKGEESIIVSADKDLLQIPGTHFVMGVTRKGQIIREDKITTQSEFDAEYKFHEQMLTGDIVDNVKALYGIGPKKAAKILANCTTIEDMQIAVIKEYKKAYALLWNESYLINATLLRVDSQYADEVGFERPKPVFYKDTEEY